jgi:hypothetical protein
LHIGDQIIEIDDQDVLKLNNFQVVALIKRAQENIKLTLRATQVDVAKVLQSSTDKERRMKEEAESREKDRIATHAAIKAGSPVTSRKADAPPSPHVPRPVSIAAPVVPTAAPPVSVKPPISLKPAPKPVVTSAPAPTPAPTPAPAPAKPVHVPEVVVSAASVPTGAAPSSASTAPTEDNGTKVPHVS